MTVSLTVIFVISCLLIGHTYVLYPILLRVLAANKKPKISAQHPQQDLPTVAVLIAAYNEEKVIVEKLKSVLKNQYPQHKLKIYVGSDASSDATEALIKDLQKNQSQIELRRFEDRVGKITIINQLQSMTDAEILILTDANVMFSETCIQQLVHPFENAQVGLVGANIRKVAVKHEGITKQETFYLSFENSVKAAESKLWNLIMGAEGGCYAIRNSLFKKVPANFIVDDFYITLQLLQRGHFALFEENALCFEDVPPDEKGEYRRKVRISAGNFQNLFFFKRLLAKPFSPLGFAFWSHKVLRWGSPFFLLTALLSSVLLGLNSSFFAGLALLQVLLMVLPIINRQMPFKNEVLKFISHFYLMNLALLAGFLQFTKGISTSVWQPVKRDV